MSIKDTHFLKLTGRKAMELYEDEEQKDMEMDLLEQLYEQAKKGGWL